MSSGNIKGITIEIDGNATKLSKALSDINKDLKGTQSSLKQVDKLLKLDPSNVVLLEQKQRLLSSAIEKTKDKLDLLKDAQEKAAEALANGDIGQEEYDALERQVESTKISLQDYEKQAEDCNEAIDMAGSADQLEDVGDAAQETGEEVGKVGSEADNSGNIFSQAWAAMSSAGLTFDISGIVTAAVDALVDLGKQAIEAADEFEQSMAIMAEGTGATGDALTDLTKSANDAYESISDANQSAQDIAGTAGELNTRFGLTGDELTDLTTDVSNFAKITGQDGASAVDSLADVIRQWGGDASDCGGLMDELTYSAQACGASASDLASGLSDNAYQWQTLGYSQEDALELMSKVAWAGGDVSDVTSGMTKAISSLSGQVDDVPGTFQEAIDMMSNWDGESDILQQTIGDTGLTIEDVFGKKAQSMAQALSTASQNTEDFSFNLDDADGRMQQTADDSVTLKDEWDRLGKGIKDNVGEAIGPALTDLVGFMADVTNGNVSFGDSASQTWNDTAACFSTMGANIKSSASSMQSNLSATWNNVKTNASQTWNNMKTTAQNSWNGLKTAAGTSFGNLKSTISEKLTSAYNVAKQQFEKLKGLCNFTWKLPSLKLPHFSMSGSLSDWLSGKGSKPSISVSWYDKAMDTARILSGATIFGAAGGSLLAGGESGNEVISGESHLLDLIAEASGQAAMNAIYKELHSMNSNLYGMMVSALKTDQLTERDVKRFVRQYA